MDNAQWYVIAGKTVPPAIVLLIFVFAELVYSLVDEDDSKLC